MPTFHNYNWPKLKPSYKTNTSSTVITRPPKWTNSHPEYRGSTFLQNVTAFNHYIGQKPKRWQREDQQLHEIPKTSTSKILYNTDTLQNSACESGCVQNWEKMLQEQWALLKHLSGFNLLIPLW